MRVSAIIAAGGRGARLGARVPKQLLPLGGRPILQWSVDAFLSSPRVDEVIVVGPPELVADPPAYLRRTGVTLVEGGARRQDSVANGFDAVDPASEVIVVHDAARPFVDGAMIARAIEGAAETGAAIAAIPSKDTVKQAVAGVDAAPLIDRTLPRDEIYLAQTPQAFRREVLADAIRAGRQGAEGTDEAALAERAGHRVRLVAGSAGNIKITTPEDLVIAEALVKDRAGAAAQERDRAGGNRAACAWRVGSGYDLHRLVEGRPLLLGGVTIPFERGLAGHSDADVLCHAITDAVLGAASAGDIGQHFPDTDDRWRGASSLALLRQAVELVGGLGYRVVNVDATVIAERPKLGPHRDAIRARLAEAVGIAPGEVSVKAKTNEGVDATGRGEAIAVHAVVLMQQTRGEQA
jgi:2-C-methyl-D-erythritol 4-phosphate cytidylyltransferase / 2-C-methyl-D-erythritol 2,4-cyclodiphosphate synthase